MLYSKAAKLKKVTRGPILCHVLQPSPFQNRVPDAKTSDST